MARKLPELGQELAADIEREWEKPQEDWARKRLLVVRLIAQHEPTAGQIMKVAGVCRQSVFTYRDIVVEAGVEALLKRDYSPGRPALVSGSVKEEFVGQLEAGKFRQAADARRRIKKRTRRSLGASGVRKILRRLGGKLKTPRKSHAKKDRAQGEAFKQELPAKLEALIGPHPAQPVRLWVLDEHRHGLPPVIRRIWGMKGVRVHAPCATRYKWGYPHEAPEVDGQNQAQLLFTPAIDRDIHALFLKQIAGTDPASLHVVIQDQAGFHPKQGDVRTPPNLKILPLPPCSPGLNPVERLGGLIKATICNRLYPTLEKLEKHIETIARAWTAPQKVSGLIHRWLADQANAGAPV